MVLTLLNLAKFTNVLVVVVVSLLPLVVVPLASMTSPKRVPYEKDSGAYTRMMYLSDSYTGSWAEKTH